QKGLTHVLGTSSTSASLDCGASANLRRSVPRERRHRQPQLNRMCDRCSTGSGERAAPAPPCTSSTSRHVDRNPTRGCPVECPWPGWSRIYTHQRPSPVKSGALLVPYGSLSRPGQTGSSRRPSRSGSTSTTSGGLSCGRIVLAGTERASDTNHLSPLVRPEGLEPPALGSEVRCSIH